VGKKTPASRCPKTGEIPDPDGTVLGSGRRLEQVEAIFRLCSGAAGLAGVRKVSPMKLFSCQSCNQLLYFENHTCERCSHRVGYLPESGTISALAPDGAQWRALAAPGQSFRFCFNAEHGTCNWLVPTRSDNAFCVACRHNGVVPDLTVAAHLQAWRLIEFAKHRLFYALLQLRLPLRTRAEDPEHGLIFEFLAESPARNAPKVMTGHDNGRITIALVEADDVEREKRRKAMGEPYRTLLGHFRHEIGHHYWDLLVRDGGQLDNCRAIFGDDQLDYGAALQQHYKDGPPPDWQKSYVSSYATTHPWEDFAETWAHYLHIIDTMEMAHAFGVRVRPRRGDTRWLEANIEVNPYEGVPIERIIDNWLPLTFALNSINRSMGQPDLYPFIITPPVIEKLGFVHNLVQGRRDIADI
jgi:hypothetical protein